jgi:glutamate N-acetyltransferase/amino-acid N-acetyltransferase
MAGAKDVGGLRPIAGMRLAVAPSGVGYEGRPDLLLAAFDEGATVAGVLTTSRMAAAPVRWTRARLLGNAAPRGLVVNAGNANCYTGAQGEADVRQTAALLCEGLGVAHRKLGDAGWAEAAAAIMTTDRFPKAAGGDTRIGDTVVRLQGITKGSTMIAPHMATTLSFLFTDARIPAPVLQAALTDAADETYNRMSVDNTQSTNDTILVFATGGAAGHPAVEDVDDPVFAAFRAALHGLLDSLSRCILDDGRGTNPLIEICVTGADTRDAARQVGRCIAESHLIRSTVGAGKPFQLGRIVASVGMAGEKVDPDRFTLALGGAVLGRGSEFPGGPRVDLDPNIRDGVLRIDVDLGIGDGTATTRAVARPE